LESEEECAYAFSKAIVIIIFVGFVIKPIFAISFMTRLYFNAFRFDL
jgi:hypothetical protein